MIEIAAPRTPEQIAAAKQLFLEYAQSLTFSLCFQDFDAEMAAFPGKYAPPGGALLLGLVDGKPLGAVGLRPLEPGVCEMKRLYTRPEARGAGLGRKLAAAIVAAGRQRNYAAMRLDTLPSMQAAIGLYRSLGFREIAPYTYNPHPGVLFMELDLRQGAAHGQT